MCEELVRDISKVLAKYRKPSRRYSKYDHGDYLSYKEKIEEQGAVFRVLDKNAVPLAYFRRTYVKPGRDENPPFFGVAFRAGDGYTLERKKGEFWIEFSRWPLSKLPDEIRGTEYLTFSCPQYLIDVWESLH